MAWGSALVLFPGNPRLASLASIIFSHALAREPVCRLLRTQVSGAAVTNTGLAIADTVVNIALVDALVTLITGLVFTAVTNAALTFAPSTHTGHADPPLANTGHAIFYDTLTGLALTFL